MMTITIPHCAVQMLIKTLFERVIESPHKYAGQWTLQGLGMLRYYFNKETRLHVWDDRYEVPNVSKIHTHPWDLRSTIIVGRLINVKMVENHEGVIPFYRQQLHCGTGGGLIGKPQVTNLDVIANREYTEGQHYRQHHREIHLSQPSRGTVTLTERSVNHGHSEDHAVVFWPKSDGSDGWVSAEPREAEPDEIKDILTNSLKLWFPEG